MPALSVYVYTHRLSNCSPPDNNVAGVKDNCLSRRNRPLICVEIDPDSAVPLGTDPGILFFLIIPYFSRNTHRFCQPLEFCKVDGNKVHILGNQGA